MRENLDFSMHVKTTNFCDNINCILNSLYYLCTMVPYLRLERNDIELMSYDLASTGMCSVSKI